LDGFGRKFSTLDFRGSRKAGGEAKLWELRLPERARRPDKSRLCHRRILSGSRSPHLNVHLHSLVLDCVYEVLPDSRGVRFLELPPPATQEALRVLADTVERLVSALRRGGYRSEGEDELLA
ncbi:MAG: hypothetical protein LC667_03620, partial [Thioalkalivibrio sp.]|nr:hypothetical protein [Thioalkalivibrio sp.]